MTAARETRSRAGSIAAGLASVAGAAAAAAAIATRRMARDVERKVPRDGRIVAVDGQPIHVVERGAGPALLLVHGLGGQLRNFTYALVDRLAADFRVVAIDRPGYGYSLPVAGVQPRLADQARLVARVIDALALDRPLLVGHSLGGAVAMAVALDHPGSIRGAALLSPLTQGQRRIPKAFERMVIPSTAVRRVLANTIMVPLGLRSRGAAEALIFAPEPAPADFGTRGGGLMTMRPASVFAASSEVSAGSGEVEALARRYPSLDVPVSILFGGADRILDPHAHGAVTAAQVPGLRYDTLPGAGHMFPLTRPDETAAWLRARAEEVFATP